MEEDISTFIIEDRRIKRCTLTARGAGLLPVAPCGISGACCIVGHPLPASELKRSA